MKINCNYKKKGLVSSVQPLSDPPEPTKVGIPPTPPHSAIAQRRTLQNKRLKHLAAQGCASIQSYVVPAFLLVSHM